MRILAILLLLAAAAPSAHAQERFALLIGNSLYEHATPLRNPQNDIEVVAASLRTVGFDITTVPNADLAGLTAEVDAFVRKVQQHDRPVVLVYYAGHGIQRQGRNYMLAVDSRLDDVGALATSAFSVDDLVSRLSAAGASLKMIVLDACRDDPFDERTRGASPRHRGLAELAPASSQLIAYSTAPGRTATDGDTGTSPYAAAFAEAVLIPGLSVRNAFDRIRETVRDRTQGTQEPWESSAIYRDFYFVPHTDRAEITEVELLSWEKEAVLDTAESYHRYLTRYPEGRFAALARQKIDNFNKDFLFRQQSRTFPVIASLDGSIDFCDWHLKTEEEDLLSQLLVFMDYRNEVVYLDLRIPLRNIMCRKIGSNSIDIVIVAAEDGSGCHRVIGTFGSGEERGRFTERCVEGAAKREELDLAEDDPLYIHGGLMLTSGGIDVSFVARTTSYYTYEFFEAEGFFEDAAILVRGLVRVEALLEEAHLMLHPIPVDPAERGLTAQFQNTLEAYRLGSEQSGLQVVSLSQRARDRAASFTEEDDDIPLTSLWDHNGSVMGLYRGGDRRMLVYHEPREALLAAGIDAGTTLFEGTSTDGRTYLGTAYTFSSRCDSHSYTVTGTVAADDSRIVLTGRPPRLDANCRVTGSRDETMVFTFLGGPDSMDQGYLPESSLTFSSYWDHNGSVMGLMRDGQGRALAYVTPRQALLPLGIDFGTVLFRGSTPDGRTYSGQAYTFSAQCASQAYAVRGTVAPDDSRIVLEGRAPVFDGSCRQTGTRSVTMVFTLMR